MPRPIAFPEGDGRSWRCDGCGSYGRVCGGPEVDVIDRVREAIAPHLIECAPIPAPAHQRSAVAAIRAALDELPSTCRYHGDRIDPDAYALHREACCDTGRPALRRRNAEAALKTLEMQST